MSLPEITTPKMVDATAEKAPIESVAMPEKAAAPAAAVTPTKAEPEIKPLARTKTAPPGYKLIKVKNAQGKIIVVKKKLSPEEIAAAEKKGEDVTPDNKASEQAKSVAYKIVSISQPDGTLVKVRRPIETKAVPAEKPAAKKAAPKAGVAAAVDEEDDLTDEQRQKMITEQKHKFRMGRSRKYRRTLLRGFAMQLIGELPDIELDHNGFQDGDQVISDDDSDLDFDSDADGHDEHDDHDDNDDHDHGNSSEDHKGINISTKAIAKNAYDTAANKTKYNKKAAPTPPPAAKARDISPDAPASPDIKSPVKEKITYKMGDKDLEKLDEDNKASQLTHHWGTFSFYFMASLSIILPLAFVLLAIGATLMAGKSKGSHWNAVDGALKFAVSAWPIVFAAVVAQCFKTYATYRVERGIKLMQLEQLVGSNSFASALKQPIMLRRLDIYTLIIFVSWCLSPIGGQAIVRVASTEWVPTCNESTMYYLSRDGVNPIFDTSDDFYLDGNNWGTHMQEATMAFSTTFDPDAGLNGEKVHYYQDSWGNPQTFMENGGLSSVFGIPYFFTESMMFAEQYPGYYDYETVSKYEYNVTGANMDRTETFTFALNSSYFQFDCGDWSILNSADMAKKVEYYELYPALTETPTFYMSYGYNDSEYDANGNPPDDKSPDMLRWGSFNWLSERYANQSASTFLSINQTSDYLAPYPNSTAHYSYIECPFKQRFVTYNITCSIAQEDYKNNAPYQCLTVGEPEYIDNSVNRTEFYDFSYDFMAAIAPTEYTGKVTITPFERFMASNGEKFDKLFSFTAHKENDGYNTSYAWWYDMSNNTTPEAFGSTFSFAFNSWMDSGYCPGACRTAYPTLLLELGMNNGTDLELVENAQNVTDLLVKNLLIPSSMFRSTTAEWCYTSDLVFVIHTPYLALLYICAVILLAMGIISVVIESRVVAPDILGYASTVARNSRYLHLPATNPTMSGADRVRKFGGTVVMMQDVKKGAAVGKIALGNKKDDSERLRTDRTYR